MITRIHYNVRIVCLLKEKTIARIPADVRAGQIRGAYAEEKYFPKHFISEDELCYLCLYFQLALDPKETPKRVLASLFDRDRYVASVEKTGVHRLSQLEIVDVISLRQLKTAA